MSEPTSSRSWGVGTILLVIIVPLIIGALLSLLVPQPIIGVIRFSDAIYDYSAKDLITMINYAREHNEIRAVVIVMNSPGGTVVDTESIYLELARLRETKPVITVVEGMAASGGYYLAANSDYILAKPNSLVGNIGVIGVMPSTPSVMDEVYSTGPYKLWGEPRDTALRGIEVAKQGFLQAVKLGRKDALKISDEVILRGQIWSGSEALQMGLIDALGTQSEALEKAAEFAHIAHYKVEDMRTLAGIPETVVMPFFFQTSEGIVTPYPNKSGVYMLYIPPTEEVQK